MFSQRMKTLYTHLREISDDFYTCWDAMPLRDIGEGFPNGCRNKNLFRYNVLYSYQNHVPQLIEMLGDRLMIESFESFKRDNSAFYARLFAFLGVEKGFSPDTGHLNKSLVVKKSAVSSIAYSLAELTLPARKKIGLTGGSMNYFRRLFIKKEQIVIPMDVRRDKEIQEYFSETYKFITSLKLSE